MREEILKAIPVFLSSMLKFILGPLEGYGLRLHFLTTILATVGGMMVSVIVVTYFGHWLRNGILKRFIKKKEENQKTETKGRMNRFIKKYGLGGVALLTPVFLTPIGGTIIAVGLGKPKSKILLFMLVSAIFWALVFTSTIYLLERLDVPEILK